MTRVKKYAWLLPALSLFAAAACKKKKHEGPPPVIPQLTTISVTNITTSTAQSGGLISSDGNAAITAAGVCWSKTNPSPDINGDTSRSTGTSSQFIANLRNLESDVVYYVRAYAINSAGVGYGNTLSFRTVNAAPEARNITVHGSLRVNEVIRARYIYFDAESNPRATAAYQWYIANDTTGAALTPVANATDSTFALTAAQQGKFMKAGITPKALIGTTTGTETRSAWIGPIGTPETVTFTYNGQPVTYGVITSAVTGRKWLDRNLGAPNAATAHDDWQNMGDLFQWGRAADGHQLIIRNPIGQLSTPVNGVTATLSTGDNPGHSLFITTSTVPFNWRSTNNPDLWQLSTGLNNVCPTGWHVPTKTEWEAEDLGKQDLAYNQLKITIAGFRSYETGRALSGTQGEYWTSTVFQNSNVLFAYSLTITDFSSAFTGLNYPPSAGLSVRCIKD